MIAVLCGAALAAPSLEATAYREATRVPWAVRSGPVHPGLEGAVRWPVAGHEGVRVDLTTRLGAFRHGGVSLAGTADVGLGVQGTWRAGPLIGGEIALGGLVGRSPQREYAPDGSGGFVGTPARWRPAARVSLAVEGGCRFGSPEHERARLVLRVRHWAEAPFSPGFIPVMVHRDVGLGLQLPLGRGRRSS